MQVPGLSFAKASSLKRVHCHHPLDKESGHLPALRYLCFFRDLGWFQKVTIWLTWYFSYFCALNSSSHVLNSPIKSETLGPCPSKAEPQAPACSLSAFDLAMWPQVCYVISRSCNKPLFFQSSLMVVAEWHFAVIIWTTSVVQPQHWSSDTQNSHKKRRKSCHLWHHGWTWRMLCHEMSQP